MGWEEDDKVEEKKFEIKGTFLNGFLIGLAGYVVNVVLFTIIISIIKKNEAFSSLAGVACVFAIIWIPICIIAGSMCSKDKIKGTIWFVVSSIFGMMLIFGSCAGMLSAF